MVKFYIDGKEIKGIVNISYKTTDGVIHRLGVIKSSRLDKLFKYVDVGIVKKDKMNEARSKILKSSSKI